MHPWRVSDRHDCQTLTSNFTSFDSNFSYQRWAIISINKALSINTAATSVTNSCGLCLPGKDKWQTEAQANLTCSAGAGSELSTRIVRENILYQNRRGDLDRTNQCFIYKMYMYNNESMMLGKVTAGTLRELILLNNSASSRADDVKRNERYCVYRG